MRFLLPALALLTLTACDSAEPDGDVGEQELITEVTLTLTNPDDASDVVTLRAIDADGDGAGIVFTPERATLRPGTVYDGAITLRDGTRDEDITAEIRDEAEEHLFRYGFSPSSAGSVMITDNESDYTTEDANGGNLAVGLAFRATVTAGASGEGELDVLLYHFDATPKQTSLDTSDEIDVDLAFPVAFGEPTL